MSVLLQELLEAKIAVLPIPREPNQLYFKKWLEVFVYSSAMTVFERCEVMSTRRLHKALKDEFTSQLLTIFGGLDQDFMHDLRASLPPWLYAERFLFTHLLPVHHMPGVHEYLQGEWIFECYRRLR